MDVFGLRPTIEEMADRIAADGYVVLAPNVFYRAGRSPVLPMPDLADPEQRARFWQAARPLIDQLTPEQLAADGARYLDYLGKVASPGPAAITGYCMGPHRLADRSRPPRSRHRACRLPYRCSAERALCTESRRRGRTGSLTGPGPAVPRRGRGLAIGRRTWSGYPAYRSTGRNQARSAPDRRRCDAGPLAGLLGPTCRSDHDGSCANSGHAGSAAS